MRAADLIHDTRERRGMTRAAVAFRAGVTEDDLAALERGEREPGRSLLETLLLVTAGEEPVYDDGLLVGARAIPFDQDERHVAVKLQMDPALRMAQALDWNRFAAQLALAGRRAARERGEKA